MHGLLTRRCFGEGYAVIYRPMNPGIHLIHKPVGPTSFSIVQACGKSAAHAPGRRPPRVCHGGTLDPFASGLLLILVEPATRLFDYLHAVPKVYEATIAWGRETDNGDPLGKVVFTGDPASLNPAKLKTSLAGFIGWQEQIPHATSAKRIDGERAYIKAHRGEAVSMPASRVYLHEAQWIEHHLPKTSRLRMTVRGGYYVRALVRDLGRQLGCGAHLQSLHRAAIGPWNDPGEGNTVEVTGRQLLPWAQTRLLSDQDVGDLRAGKTIVVGELQPADWLLPPGFPGDEDMPVRGFHREKFHFLLKREEAGLRAIAAFRGGI